jgi:hypothetical protein
MRGEPGTGRVGPVAHGPWIDPIRHTIVGGLTLGYGFLWGDLTCYALGLGLGILIECVVLHDRTALEA